MVSVPIDSSTLLNATEASPRRDSVQDPARDGERFENHLHARAAERDRPGRGEARADDNADPDLTRSAPAPAGDAREQQPEDQESRTDDRDSGNDLDAVPAADVETINLSELLAAAAAQPVTARAAEVAAELDGTAASKELAPHEVVAVRPADVQLAPATEQLTQIAAADVLDPAADAIDGANLEVALPGASRLSVELGPLEDSPQEAAPTELTAEVEPEAAVPVEFVADPATTVAAPGGDAAEQLPDLSLEKPPAQPRATAESELRLSQSLDAEVEPAAPTADSDVAEDGRQRFPEQLLSRVESGAGRPAELDGVDQSRFVDRVARALQVAQSRGGTLRLRLHPPELGAVRLELRVENGALTARLETETAAARSALWENLPVLRDRLAEQGVRIEQFEIDSPDQQNRGASTENQHDERSGDAERRQQPRVEADEEIVRETTVARSISEQQIDVVA